MWQVFFLLVFSFIFSAPVSSCNALFVGMEEGLFLSFVFVFGLVLLQSRLVVVINLSEWGDIGGVFMGIISKHP